MNNVTTESGTDIKLRSLKIQRLHGHYNYDVRFNHDVTFLYGLNGCGKTIILDILEAIIKGQIYRLSKYDFKKIILSYSFGSSKDNKCQIAIIDKGNKLSINYKGDSYSLPRIEKDFFIINEDNEAAYHKLFYNKYPFLCRIGIDFHYINPSLYYVDELFKYNKTIHLDEFVAIRHILMFDRIKAFLEVINEFLNVGKNPKKIVIDDNMKFYCKDLNSDECIDLKYLSLGEQKIIALFCYLTIRMPPRFLIIDEPEKSLHLSWQKIFVDKILDVNPNLQLIFTTHAPETIGQRRNKIRCLEKKYVK